MRLVAQKERKAAEGAEERSVVLFFLVLEHALSPALDELLEHELHHNIPLG
jgi:hypothetical protein